VAETGPVKCAGRSAEAQRHHLGRRAASACRAFKLSNDPRFEEKFWDVIGLYLDPPAKALVLCCDEKSQCQALERTQLGARAMAMRCRIVFSRCGFSSFSDQMRCTELAEMPA